MIQRFKDNFDILEIAISFGFKGKKCRAGRMGSCPRLTMSKGRCLIIWPTNQTYYCFHCDAGGDVIDLVQLYKRCDFQEAVTYLADYAGIKLPSCGFQEEMKKL